VGTTGSSGADCGLIGPVKTGELAQHRAGLPSGVTPRGRRGGVSNVVCARARSAPGIGASRRLANAGQA